MLRGTTPAVLWLDNFSKNMARQTPNLLRGVFASMMWTGLALRLYDGPAVDMSVVFSGANVVPAMPTDPMITQEDMLQFIAESLPQTDGVPLRFGGSLSNRYLVDVVPPKINPIKLKTEYLRTRCANSRDGLHRMYPFDIWEHNIGANLGLMSVIRKAIDEHHVLKDSNYHVWVVDINIFNRLLKVRSFPVCLNIQYRCLFCQFVYDHSGIGKVFGRKVHITLGLWHNFKQASIILWRRFSLDFIGPLFHHMFPGVQFFAQNPKLVHVTTMLTYIRMSYPSWKDDLQNLRTDRTLHRSSRAHVHNLTALVEFFIPTVPFVVVSHVLFVTGQPMLVLFSENCVHVPMSFVRFMTI